MFDIGTIVVVAATFLVAGVVKGAVGLGLPSVGLALLTIVLDLPTAMALLLVPTFGTNVWQASVGDHGRVILRRLWPFLFMATVTVWVGASALTRVDVAWLSALLGVLLVSYATVNLRGIRLTVPARHESWVGPLAGAVNGVLTGMTGSSIFPGVMFMQALGLSRDALVQAMGMLFLFSTLALALVLQQSNLLTVELGTLSFLALVPASIGLTVGKRIRQRLSKDLFHKVFLVALLTLGTYIVATSLGSFG